MRDRLKRFLLILFLVIGITYLFFHGLALAKGVLAPIFLALILAMMLVPVANFLEKKGIKKGWAAFLSDLIFALFILGVFWAVGMEIQKITNQWSSIQDRLSSQFSKVESFIEKNSGFSVENPFTQGASQQGAQQGNPQANQQPGQGSKNQVGNQQQGTRQASKGEKNKQAQQQQEGQQTNQQTSPGGGPGGDGQQQGNQQQTQQKGKDSGGGLASVKNYLTTALSKAFSFLATILLISVYIFFMLLYRRKFWKAVLRFVPDEQQEKGRVILNEIIRDARQYLVGNFLLVVLLTIIYSIGFSFSGMKSPVTTAFLAALLSLVPYIGNIIGGIIALGIAYITTGKLSAVWIVLATFAIAQFVESYFIEPYLVGNRVKVNPLFTLFAVIIGGAVWGVIGMIVFLPLFSFAKAVADHVPMLQPVGYAIGNEDAGEGEGMGTKVAEKVKGWFS